jgi:S1-C subfamily serine protease
VRLTDGRMLKAKRVGGDPDFDLAVISVPAERLAAMPFGDSRQLPVFASRSSRVASRRLLRTASGLPLAGYLYSAVKTSGGTWPRTVSRISSSRPVGSPLDAGQ